MESTRTIPARRGVYNALGSFNCFVNVCVQSVWHLASVRRALASLSATHACFQTRGGEARGACMVCALRGTGLRPPERCLLAHEYALAKGW